ncbi:conserved hypothetical protein [Xenorhabdus nematophila F1]|uniref:Uncharacterized protein n=1 Tax=Xenorhabdus nematophila (strain ATCC 19061 / DSM 3370 / CCUG 14189 / LMG 1036 / NCIMB 9965 / AN6) TaxID=406817 RepID=D3VHM4_XENNA|nr:hypothetical protein XNC1_2615 [Xenorhabdus nematophila ATCC 19061]CCW29980.1 conserved hypothetical protein [Xenorhabdus nematophila F1]CEE90092.1 hypothetical protein XNA1_1170004 [Xenorhabdus nematophila str. Anatoliense]CEF29707.1 hypothetical protein XNW1_1970005 [Xenorhabdus nematophila str. Websteri]CEK23506.1 hypothetical protein XNC2_2512 [Xenorhabdus nematophila AN6/1]
MLMLDSVLLNDIHGMTIGDIFEQYRKMQHKIVHTFLFYKTKN